MSTEKLLTVINSHRTSLDYKFLSELFIKNLWLLIPFILEVTSRVWGSVLCTMSTTMKTCSNLLYKESGDYGGGDRMGSTFLSLSEHLSTCQAKGQIHIFFFLKKLIVVERRKTSRIHCDMCHNKEHADAMRDQRRQKLLCQKSSTETVFTINFQVSQKKQFGWFPFNCERLKTQLFKRIFTDTDCFTVT